MGLGQSLDRGQRRQQHQSEGTNQQHPPRPQTAIPTEKIVHRLDNKIKEWNTITENIIKEKDFSSVTREYVHTLLTETEKELHAYNQTLWKEQRVRKHDEEPGMSSQHEEIKEDSTKNKQLKTSLATANDAYRDAQKTIGNLHDDLKEMKMSLATANECCKNAEKTIKNLHDDLKPMQMPLATANEYSKHAGKTIEALQNDIRQLRLKCTTLRQEKEQLTLRLSKMAGEKLVANNPNIADLSDSNRPTKLGEKYSELYDNQWTDAFEGLQEGGYDDMEAIEILRLTLLDAVDFCKEKANMHLKKSTEIVDDLFESTIQKDIPKEEAKAKKMLTMGYQKGPDPIQKREKTALEELQLVSKIYSRWQPKIVVKEQSGTTTIPKETMMNKKQRSIEDKYKMLRKEVALSLVPAVQKAYIKLTWSKSCLSSMKPYIKKCIFVGWLMVVQTPAMALVNSDVKAPQFKSKFDKDLYKVYTTSGPTMEYVVWPALLLEEGGPVICKGVAQCIK